MQHFVLATRNRHKTREFAGILGAEFEVRDLTEFENVPTIEETGRTFEENATLKAVQTSSVIAGLVVADDSGLEIDALGGAPGVYSARYAGEPANDRANVAKVLKELVGAERRARFRCVLVLARDGKKLSAVEGTVEGTITREPRGSAGFGYDPIFMPEGYTQTFAELQAEVKNQTSHRACAIAKLRDYLLRDLSR